MDEDFKLYQRDFSFLYWSRFPTGQEITQFFVSYGYLGFAGTLISLVLYLYMCSSFMYVGKTSTFKQANDVTSVALII